MRLMGSGGAVHRVVRLGISALSAMAFLAACTLSTPSSTSSTPTSTSSTTLTTSSTTASERLTVPPATSTTEPNLCSGVFCVRYEIDNSAYWSDGQPVTAEDFVHTYEAIASRSPDTIDMSGYDLISNYLILNDKEVLFVFSDVYPPWRELFRALLPAHDPQRDGDFDAPGAPVTGPFELEEWLRGERIVLRRSPTRGSMFDPVTGSLLGNVEELIFIFPESVRDQIQGLERDEIDVIIPQPLDWIVDDLSDSGESVTYEVVPGPFWDHLDFNHDHPFLSQRWVREAISMAIDREAILDETVRTVDPSAVGLDSAVFLSNSIHYRHNYESRHDPEVAERIMTDHGCAKGDTGVFECFGTPMSFRLTTTIGDAFRERTAQLVREQLADVGIELIVEQRLPSELFSTSFFFGGPDIWEILDFSWKGDADPHLANTTFYCEGDAPNGHGLLNVNRYCNEEVENIVRATEGIFDLEERMRLYNQADALYLENVAIIPLFQKPVMMAWSSDLVGVEPNISPSTHLWNVGSWSGKETVVIALESEPDSLDPLQPDDSASVILSAMNVGAFTVNPSLEFIPTLVTDAEPMLGDE